MVLSKQKIIVVVVVVLNYEKYDSNTDKCRALISVVIATIKPKC